MRERISKTVSRDDKSGYQSLPALSKEKMAKKQLTYRQTKKEVTNQYIVPYNSYFVRGKDQQQN